MPRKVDAAARRRELIEAVWAITAREGLCAVSFRDVAAEAGVSVRRVQYYFPTKAVLLRGALELLDRRVVERAARWVDALGPRRAPSAVLRAAIAASLPTDDESRLHTALFFSFYVSGLTDPALGSADAGGVPQWTVGFAADLIRRGRTRAGVDPDRDAAVLMAAFAGLSLSILAGTTTAEDALASIDHQLARIFKP